MHHSLANTSVNLLFLDANLLLEIILGRAKQGLVKNLLQAADGELFISALTAHLVVHFGQPIVGLPVVRQFLADYTILGLDSADFDWAYANARNQDFEDALQLAVAIRNGCGTFMTFDGQLAKAYGEMPAISVKQLK